MSDVPGSDPAATPASPATPEAPPPDVGGFAALGLAPDLLRALATLGYEEPTPIQEAAIPPLLAGRDVLGQAATGTGKTAAFALPLLQRAAEGAPTPRRPRALVLVPTRELALQVAEAIETYGRGRRASVLAVYGGEPIFRQIRVLERGVAVVVATPGRARDHLERGSLELDQIATLVLDEADEMLDLGFAEDLDAIFERAPATRQTALFSATLPARILSVAEKRLRDPVRAAVAAERPRPGEAPKVRQTAYVVERRLKPAALGRILAAEEPASTLVFCRTRVEVDELTEAMNARGFRAEALHGGFAQELRDRVMRRFRSGAANLLIATDVAARGLDVDRLSHVVNFDAPSSPDTYVHRIGRTGRAGRDGVAVTLVEPRELRLLRTLETVTRRKIPFAAVPTGAELRRRRLERLAATVRAALAEGVDADYRALVDAVSADADPKDVAAVALKLAHAASGRDAPDDVPDAAFAPPPRPGPPPRPARFERGSAPGRPRPGRPHDGADGPPRRVDAPGSAWLFVGAGRDDRIRPADLVGAITGETGLGRDVVGAVDVAERHSLVEVRGDVAEHIVRALRAAKLRGRRVVVRRARPQ